MDITKTFKKGKRDYSAQWISLGGEESILVCPTTSPGFQKATMDILKKYALEIEMNPNRADELDEELLPGLYATHILKDWKGINADGKEVPYSKEVAQKLLDEYPGFLDLDRRASSIANRNITGNLQEDIESLKKL